MEATPRAALVTRIGDRHLRLERMFDAPREKVWRAYTEPDLVARWWGRGNPLDVEELDVRPGGHWRFLEHGPEGDSGFEGRFSEAVPPERLAQTFDWDGMPGHPSAQTATFEDAGDGRTRFVGDVWFMQPEELDGMLASGMETGMNMGYAALDKVLASME